MESSVLILGNGLSRLLFHAEIEAYEGEVWGCNYVYLEYPHKVTRLAGHVTTMIAAQKYAEENGLPLKVYGGNQGSFPKHFCTYTCRPEFLKDSGTTLVAQALSEHRPQIDVCGFDLGGADVGSERHWRLNKSQWISRWRKLYDTFREDWTVCFWGQDHLPIIASDDGRDRSRYVGSYRLGNPHITDDRYVALHYALFGIPASLEARKPKDKVVISWHAEPYTGRVMTVQRWWAEIERKRGHCEITFDPMDQEALENRERIEAKIDEVVDALPWRSMELMAERRGMGTLNGMSRREALTAIGAADQ